MNPQERLSTSDGAYAAPQSPIRRSAAPSCDGCGKTEHLALYPDRAGETLCPACARMYQLGRGAEIHLASLVEDILPAWASHWLAVGVEPGYMREILAGLSGVLNGDGADGKRLDERLADMMAELEAN